MITWDHLTVRRQFDSRSGRPPGVLNSSSVALLVLGEAIHDRLQLVDERHGPGAVVLDLVLDQLADVESVVV